MTNRSLQLTQRQTRILADMGIDVWYPRRASGSTATEQGSIEPSSQPLPQQDLASLKFSLNEGPALEQAQVAGPPVVPESRTALDPIAPIRFYHLHNEGALLLSAEPLSGQVGQFALDLLLSSSWEQRGANKMQPEFSEFNWPLTDNVGTPERALLAFMDKFGVGGKGGRILLCSEVIRALIDQWVPLLDQSYVLIPNFSELMVSADAKRNLWHRLSVRK